MRARLLAAMLVGVLAAGCSGTSKPDAPATPSQTDAPAVTPTPAPSPTPSAGCTRRSGDNGYPVDIGRASGFCMTWANAEGASGYRNVSFGGPASSNTGSRRGDWS